MSGDTVGDAILIVTLVSRLRVVRLPLNTCCLAGQSAIEGGGGAGSEDDNDGAGSALSLTWGVDAGLEL